MIICDDPSSSRGPSLKHSLPLHNDDDDDVDDDDDDDDNHKQS